MSSKLEQLAAAVRAVGAKTGPTRRSLTDTQRDARNLAAAIPRDGAGPSVAGHLAEAAKKAQHAEALLARFSEEANALAARLAQGSAAHSNRGFAKLADAALTTVTVGALFVDTVTLGLAINYSLPQPLQFIPPSFDGRAVLREVDYQEKQVSNLYDVESMQKEASARQTLWTIADGGRPQTSSLDPRPPKGRGTAAK